MTSVGLGGHTDCLRRKYARSWTDVRALWDEVKYDVFSIGSVQSLCVCISFEWKSEKSMDQHEVKRKVPLYPAHPNYCPSRTLWSQSIFIFKRKCLCLSSVKTGVYIYIYITKLLEVLASIDAQACAFVTSSFSQVPQSWLLISWLFITS